MEKKKEKDKKKARKSTSAVRLVSWREVLACENQ